MKEILYIMQRRETTKYKQYFSEIGTRHDATKISSSRYFLPDIDNIYLILLS